MSTSQKTANHETARIDGFVFTLPTIFRPTRPQILRMCKYLIRKLEYEEIARVDPMRALNYLQTRLNEIINHEDAKELVEFHKLASLLFKPVDAPGDTNRLAAVISPLPLATTAGTTTGATNPSSPDTSSMDDDETSGYGGASSSVGGGGGMVLAKESSGGDLSSSSTAAEQQIMIKSQRCLLYNRLVELMPDQILCQPRGNLSDLVLI